MVPFGALQRAFLGGEGAQQGGGALGERVVALLEFGVLRLARDALGAEFGEPRLQAVALVRQIAGAPVLLAQVLGAGEQVLARFAQQLLARLRARLQRVEAGALAGDFVLVALVGFVERAGQARALDRDLGEVGFHVAQPALHGGERRFGLGHFARQPRGLGARFVEESELRAFLVLGHRQALTRAVGSD